MPKIVILFILSLFIISPLSKQEMNQNTSISSVKFDNLKLVKSDIVKQFDSFHKITHRFIPKKLQDQIYEQSKSIYHLRRIRIDHRYRIFYEDNEFKKFEYDIDSKGYYSATLEHDSLQVEIKLYEFRRDTVFAQVKIDDMLISSISAQGIDDILAIELAQIFAWDIDFTFDIRKNDVFNIFYEKKYLDNEYKGIGNIISANYLSQKDTTFIYRRELENKAEYFNAEGQNIKKAFLKAPVHFTRISSGFSYKRYHPILKRYKPHFGTDYVADINTPVYAIADGTVMFRGYKKNNGNFVHLRHNGGYESKYLHFNSIPNSIQKYAKVKQGEIIGFIGKTGLATGYHVCFRFYLNGYPYDFKKIENPIVSQLKKSERIEFNSLKSQFDYTFESSNLD